MLMRRALTWIVFSAGLVLAACARGPSGQAEFAARSSPDDARVYDFSWSRDPLWDDGQAEVALYTARRPQYGKIESYEALLIVVKEVFNRRLHVKAEPPYEGKDPFPVLKLNASHQYWTPNYPYHFLLSVYVRQDVPTSLVKVTLGSQEWCSNTFKEVRTWGRRPELIFHSYFDGESDGARPLDLRPGDLLEDQLPVALRSIKFAEGLKFERRIMPSLISNNMRTPLNFATANITVAGQEEVGTGLGRLPAWKVNLQSEGFHQSWWFERSPLHGLLKMESSDGRFWALKSRTRRRYWKGPTYRPEMQLPVSE